MLVFSNLSVVFLGLGILLSILAIVLFFVYRIPQIQKVLSGRAANEEIDALRESRAGTWANPIPLSAGDYRTLIVQDETPLGVPAGYTGTDPSDLAFSAGPAGQAEEPTRWEGEAGPSAIEARTGANQGKHEPEPPDITRLDAGGDPQPASPYADITRLADDDSPRKDLGLQQDMIEGEQKEKTKE